jgi:hypothetical protein
MRSVAGAVVFGTMVHIRGPGLTQRQGAFGESGKLTWRFMSWAQRFLRNHPVDA